MTQRNNNTPEISIIIPVYNSEKYLKNTLDSVLGQTYRDFELILIDDGSPDGCGRICDEYALKDCCITVYHIDNIGSSGARNYGLDIARGRYIGFVDSDDEIEPDMYELLHDMIEINHADIAMCGLADVYAGRVINPIDKPVYRIMDSKEAILTVFEAKLTSVTPVNKLYKKEVFDGIRYPIGADSGEDASVIVDLLMRCDRVVLCTEQKYRYIHREGSITTREFKPSDISVITAYRKNYRLIKQYYPDIIDVAVMRLCWAYFFVLDKLLKSDNKKEYKDIEKKLVIFLRRNLQFILADKRFNKTRKLAALVLKLSVEGYRELVILQSRRRRVV